MHLASLHPSIHPSIDLGLVPVLQPVSRCFPSCILSCSLRPFVLPPPAFLRVDCVQPSGIRFQDSPSLRPKSLSLLHLFNVRLYMSVHSYPMLIDKSIVFLRPTSPLVHSPKCVLRVHRKVSYVSRVHASPFSILHPPFRLLLSSFSYVYSTR